jgi:hypothetical protein
MNIKRICDIKGFEDIENYYKISEKGYVISSRNGIERILVNRLSSNGYFYVILMDVYCKTRQLRINRLVASAFIPNPYYKPIVDHEDDNRLNNKADNLQWFTYAENTRKRFRRKPIEGQISIDMLPVVHTIPDEINIDISVI